MVEATTALASSSSTSNSAFAACLAARPTPVSGVSWEMLAIAADQARRLPAREHPALRVVVQAVVREMRAGAAPWESVYAALRAVVGAPSASAPLAGAEHETHPDRATALVAHMQSWADLERLAELDGESSAA